MAAEIYLIVLIVFVALYLLAPKAAGAYLRYRGKRVITCPETRKPAAVVVDAKHAALRAVFSYPDLRLENCSRWPERQDCGQACLLQVRLSPEDCLVRNILATWYDGKCCVSCGRQFGEIHWSDQKPALLRPDGRTVEWGELAPEEIPEALRTQFPVCWNCHITETFCRLHPEMIVDRSRVSPGVHRDMVV
jgi:hypothetical protein